MLKAGFISLGCPKNLIDTELMLGILSDNKISITNNPEEADILIVNTCSFIDSAKEESITTILQMGKYKDEGNCKGLIVTGCLSQRYAKELLEEIPEIDAVVGTGSWHRIMEAVEAVSANRRISIIDDFTNNYDGKTARVVTTPKHTAYIKIAEGCNNCCSYCIIPKLRGRYRSRTIESIMDEAYRLSESGVKEIILIAQDTTNYGNDLYGQPELVNLLKELIMIEEIHWIRLLYCYPNNFSDELIELIAAEPKICSYIDLPLQHAHNDVLRRMNRKDTLEDIEILLTKIRRQIPGVAIRTSFIVGFPGETDEQFNSLKEFVMEQKFDRVGVFPYSQEEGTPAGSFDDQISETVKQERYHELMTLQCKISEDINIALEGTTMEILIEGKSAEQPGVCYGRSYREAPEIDGIVYVENCTEGEAGQFIKGAIVQGFTYDLLAQKVLDNIK